MLVEVSEREGEAGRLRLKRNAEVLGLVVGGVVEGGGDAVGEAMVRY